MCFWRAHMWCLGVRWTWIGCWAMASPLLLLLVWPCHIGVHCGGWVPRANHLLSCLTIGNHEVVGMTLLRYHPCCLLSHPRSSDWFTGPQTIKQSMVAEKICFMFPQWECLANWYSSAGLKQPSCKGMGIRGAESTSKRCCWTCQQGHLPRCTAMDTSHPPPLRRKVVPARTWLWKRTWAVTGNLVVNYVES